MGPEGGEGCRVVRYFVEFARLFSFPTILVNYYSVSTPKNFPGPKIPLDIKLAPAYATPMTQLALPLIDVDPKFILEVASGLIEPAQLAENYGYTPEEWLFLKNHEPFVKQVDAKKAELKATGFTFKLKAAIAAEDLLESVYVKAKEKDSSLHVQLETLKFMARAAGIDAPVREQNVGAAFSISINLGNGQSVQIGTQTHQAPMQDVVDAEDIPSTQTVSFSAYTPIPLT